MTIIVENGSFLLVNSFSKRNIDICSLILVFHAYVFVRFHDFGQSYLDPGNEPFEKSALTSSGLVSLLSSLVVEALLALRQVCIYREML